MYVCIYFNATQCNLTYVVVLEREREYLKATQCNLTFVVVLERERKREGERKKERKR